MAEYWGVKVEDIFNSMSERFRPEGAKDVDTVFGYDIRDEGTWKLTVKDNKMKLEKIGDLSGCIAIIKADGETFVGINTGNVDATNAFMGGKVKVEGDIAAFGKTSQFFCKFVNNQGGVPEQELLVLKKLISINQKFSTGPILGKFLKELKGKRILANKCPECGRMQLPPREVCADCRVRVNEFVEVGPGGEVRYMDMVYYSTPDPLTGAVRETPYGAIHILLDGCKGNETIPHLLRKDQTDRIEMGWNEKKGTRVRPVWEENRIGDFWDIKYFEIDE